MEIWHNPRCSKSRAAKAALDAAGVTYTERRYLDRPPTADELDRVLTAIGAEPWEVARLNEPVAKELGLKDLPRQRARWIEVMVAHPVLIQRPIIITDDGRAVVARDEAAVKRALEGA
ncbi:MULTISPECIES: ArsC/Spx/MgsR family protein [Thermomonospora]|uniref:Arsenate reductase-like protein n=1 Tax=Thermomonospora curvata (strain ATCC 19995 / DSM 43183 / JCM 3096 / KCTC 9072 / NBRC 15933 / NCIMB 10081 / Henssen B9) TaxID=471852 RepID=D1A8S6_THECD|nr:MULTISPECIES: ArsC/Spx/MgsR family protein [Thermomonospora]ACY98564.1 arsenate reductase-like protein [Thermomonospora curvata DSM 43183]PKK13704.1 MAG: arsenate reductase [Thermomonospora sp. CIF 1]